MLQRLSFVLEKERNENTTEFLARMEYIVKFIKPLDLKKFIQVNNVWAYSKPIEWSTNHIYFGKKNERVACHTFPEYLIMQKLLGKQYGLSFRFGSLDENLIASYESKKYRKKVLNIQTFINAIFLNQIDSISIREIDNIKIINKIEKNDPDQIAIGNDGLKFELQNENYVSGKRVQYQYVLGNKLKEYPKEEDYLSGLPLDYENQNNHLRVVWKKDDCIFDNDGFAAGICLWDNNSLIVSTRRPSPRPSGRALTIWTEDNPKK